MQFWATRTPETGTIETQATRAEAAGWDGITFTDSQNLIGDPFVAVALAGRATEHLRFGTGVANAAITVQEETGGRFTLGVGRGDTALFHLGRKPQPVADFGAALADVQAYLAGETLDLDGRPSRIRWLDRAKQAKVPLDVAARWAVDRSMDPLRRRVRRDAGGDQSATRAGGGAGAVRARAEPDL